MQHIILKTRTLGTKAMKAEVLALAPSVVSFTKRHVPGCGYVFYATDNNDVTRVQISKTRQGCVATVK